MKTSAPRRILAGVSGSPAGQRAIEAAAREADSRDCPLHLVHALHWLPDVADDPTPTRNLLRQAAVAATHVAPTLTITTELVEGHPLAGLLRLSRSAALTVIGDGDLNDLTCMPREALAVQVAARAFSTVMITRATPAPCGPVLAGVDGSPAAGPVLDFAFDAAVHRGNRLLVVNVGEAGNRPDALETVVASRAIACGIDVRLRVLEGDPATVLARESHEASLIVVGARGLLPYHGLLGSVTQTLLHHGRAPVAVVRGTRSAPGRPARTGAPMASGATARARVSDAPAWRTSSRSLARGHTALAGQGSVRESCLMGTPTN